MERLKPATELKLVGLSRGNDFHAFTRPTRSLKKTRPCTSVATPFKQFKAVTTRVDNKTKLKEAISTGFSTFVPIGYPNTNVNVSILRCIDLLIFQISCRITRLTYCRPNFIFRILE